jgi:hypothetical protein
MNRLAGFGAWTMFLLLMLQVFAAAFFCKSVSWDPSYGMLAAQQFVVWVSPSPFQLVQADPDDLTRVKADAVPFWAPLYQAVPYCFRFGGALNWGAALNVTTVLFLLLGITGWRCYFLQIVGRGDLANWLTAGLLATRFCCMNSLTYDGGNLLLWGLAPWAVVLTIRCAKGSPQATGMAGAIAAGIFTGSLFAAKYSAVFVCAGLFVGWLVRCLADRRFVPRTIGWGAGALAAVAFVHVLGFPKYSVARVTGLHLGRGALSLGLWTLGPGDVDAMLGKPLDWAKMTSEAASPAVGLALLLLIAISVWSYLTGHRRGDGSSPEADHLSKVDRVAMTFGITAAMVDIGALAALIAAGSNISLHARFGRISGLLLLPILVLIWLDLLARRDRLSRYLGGFCLSLVFVVPCIYGPLSVLPKWAQAYGTRRSAVGSDGVANAHLPRSVNHEVFYSELKAAIAPDTVLYSIYPQMVFPLAQHPCIIVDAEEDYTPQSLRQFRYRGNPAGGVALLVRSGFIRNGKLQAIEQSFVEVRGWQNIPLPADPTWSLWVSQ